MPGNPPPNPPFILGPRLRYYILVPPTLSMVLSTTGPLPHPHPFARALIFVSALNTPVSESNSRSARGTRLGRDGRDDNGGRRPRGGQKAQVAQVAAPSRTRLPRRPAMPGGTTAVQQELKWSRPNSSGCGAQVFISLLVVPSLCFKQRSTMIHQSHANCALEVVATQTSIAYTIGLGEEILHIRHL